MRLYFFPGLLPLAPLVPWLLTAVGALAGGLRTLKKRRGLGWVAIACFGFAAGFAYRQASLSPRDVDGTRLTPADSMPTLKAEAAADPSSVTGAADVSSPMTETLLRERWFQLTPRRGTSSPFLAGDLLLVGTGEGTLDAFSRQSGSLRWSLKKHQTIVAAPMPGPGATLFVGEGVHTAVTSSLTAVSLPGGRPLWQREFIGHLEEPPTVDAAFGLLWQGSGPRGLWALDPRDGRVVWHARLGHVDSRPLLAGDLLAVSAQPEEDKLESALFVLDPRSGRTLSTLPLPGQPWGSPALVPGSASREAVLTTAVGQIGPPRSTDRGWSHRVSLEKSRVRWSVELPGMPLPESAILPEKGLVYHTLKHGLLVAQRLRDGSIAWTAELGGEIHAPAALIRAGRRKPLLAAVTITGVLTLRDAGTGAELERMEVGRDSSSTPLYSDGMLYVVTPGTLAAYELKLR